MKSQHLLLVVLVVFLTGISSFAVAEEGEELVEKMSIKSVDEKFKTADSKYQADISTSKVVMKHIPLGHAMVLTFPLPFTRVSVANPDVADQLVLSPTQVYMTGKAVGFTTLTVWGKDHNILFVLELSVHLPIEGLQRNLSTLFPEEKDIVITTAHDHLVLTGQVASADMKSKVGAVAGAYAPAKVLNFLKLVHE
ncbi:MAG: pilus assembly protein N-terminal domain-containing protein [Nitrospirales bacterium]